MPSKSLPPNDDFDVLLPGYDPVLGVTGLPTTPRETERLRNLAALLSHEVRLRIIVAMSTGQRESPKSLYESGEDVPLGTWAYHMRKLLQGGAVELVEKRPRRGSDEHIYLLRPLQWDLLSSFIARVLAANPTSCSLPTDCDNDRP